ncbi:hypothetical protein [Ruminococcus sp.]|uniref:hypothetical protein n=1 Tax=Ruminococcus sp. TaxID=41978 RepID=UPI00386C5530
MGKAHNTFPLCKALIDKQPAVCQLEHSSVSILIAIATQNRKDILFLFINYFLFLKAVACFVKLCSITQTALLFVPDKLLYWKILWALPIPASL